MSPELNPFRKSLKTLHERVCSRGSGAETRRRWSILLAVLACSGALSSTAATYYAAVNGSSSNTGLSTNSPWPLSYALANCGASSTVIVMPGTYTTEAIISSPYVTLKSQVKWGARIVGGSPTGIVTWPESTVHDVTIDGFEVASASQCGIEIYGSNCIVRNCWIHNSGSGFPSQNSSGIAMENTDGNCLFENNLCENNGWNEGGPYDHGIYLKGNNNIARNNVLRGNWGCGIALRITTGTSYIYNNLIYNNHYYGFGGSQYPAGTTVIFVNNTLVEPGYTFYGDGTARYLLTNNICYGSKGVDLTGGMLSGDYNLLGSSSFAQGHGKVASSAQFVNSASGLYWLQSGSPARGMALSTAHTTVDFFGNAQGSVTDVGAFQYNPSYAADNRVLDPSPAGGANYWLALGSSGGQTNGGSGGSGSGGGSTGSGYSFAASAATLTAPFVLTNGYISQMVNTGIADGGKAVFQFSTSTAGVYVVSAVVNAPDVSANSFYVTIDGTASEPYTVWDIPASSGFQSQTVSWRGNGVGETDEFMPKAFALAAGSHTLTVIGREQGVQLQSIQVQPTSLTPPSAAPVLRLLAQP